MPQISAAVALPYTLDAFGELGKFFGWKLIKMLELVDEQGKAFVATGPHELVAIADDGSREDCDEEDAHDAQHHRHYARNP